MTVSSRPVRRMDRERRFNLRTTALFFALLAIILCGLVLLVRTAASILERRPLWSAYLVVMGIAVAVLCRSRWRRFSAARYARRAARALEEAAERASDSLDAGAEDQGVPTDARDDRRGEPDADDFEQAIAGLCARDACREVEVVGGAGDLGADVVAVTPEGLRVVIQCKLYDDGNKVGSQDLQRFGGTCFSVHEADVAALVTTGDFTAPALEYADRCGIVCVNGQELAAWSDGIGPSPWESAGIDA
ncbi:restriction endonuclease [Streptomyces sp. NPDC059900]|uniref:restriction endonuclease n=1 Tax=Streptomyces sp. NPDC059900 TaxID=3155816 RepID=UPI003445A23D